MDWKPAYNKKSVKLISDKTLTQDFLKVTQKTLQHRLFSSEKWSIPMVREVSHPKPSVVVLPYDPIAQKIVLIEQFRVGAFSANLDSPWMLEAIAGIIEPGEDVQKTAKREAQEEAACDILDWYPLARYLPSSGNSSEVTDVLCGRFDASKQSLGVYGVQAESEDIKNYIFSLEEAESLLANQLVLSAGAVVALQALLLQDKNIKKAWEIT